jgi:hypothetical protein
MTTWFHWNSQGFESCAKGGKGDFTGGMSSERRGGGRETRIHTREARAQGSPEHGRRTDHRRGGEVAGEGWRTPETERERQRTERSGCRPRAREGKVFLKTGYGRTGQSTVPVRCTPDSA